MYSDFTAFLKRVRVRVWPLLLVLLAALPSILEGLGLVDLRPVLEPLLGTEKATSIIAALSLILAVMRPIVHLLPTAEAEGP